jgi:putative ABC transport system substrate-binding protein
MRRRELLAVATVAFSFREACVLADHPRGMHVIGYLSSIVPYEPSLTQFFKALAIEGYLDGKNIVIEYRSAEGRYDRLPALAAELVDLPVDIIVCAGGTVTARAAKLATEMIPIVMVSGADPVAAGLVTSLSRPGGNITGVAQLVVEADTKRVELLHELLPGIGTFGYLQNPTLPNTERGTPDIEEAAAALGVSLMVVKASEDISLPRAFNSLKEQKMKGLLIQSDPYFFMRRNDIVALANEHALPTMYFFRDFVTAGGLISYGTRLGEAFHQVGMYTSRILKGARPTDLRITQQSEKIELLINLNTARSLKLSVPQTLLVRADEVIE